MEQITSSSQQLPPPDQPILQQQPKQKELSEKQIRLVRSDAPKKILIASVDTILSRMIAEELRNDHLYLENGDIILGIGETKQISDYKVITFHGNEDKICRLALEADLILLDLVNCEEVSDLILRTLLIHQSKQDAHIICLSTVQTWSRTVLPPVKKEMRQNRTVGSQITEYENGQKGVIPMSKYAYREFHPSYYYVYQLENLAQQIKRKHNLKINIITLGLLYGMGEGDLLPLFQDLFNNCHIVCYEHKCTEIVPMIYIQHAVHFILQTISLRPSDLFLSAIQNCSHSSKEEILAALTNKIQGRELVIEKADYLKEGVKDYFQELDLILTRTQYNVGEFTMEEDKKTPTFLSMLDQVIDQYLRFRPLNVRHIVILTQNQDQRTALLQNYNMLQVINEEKLFSPQNEELAARLEEERQQLQQERQQHEEMLKKKKKDLEPFNKDFSEELVKSLWNQVLNKKTIRNMGYVLDNVKFEYGKYLADEIDGKRYSPTDVILVIPPVIPQIQVQIPMQDQQNNEPKTEQKNELKSETKNDTKSEIKNELKSRIDLKSKIEMKGRMEKIEQKEQPPSASKLRHKQREEIKLRYQAWQKKFPQVYHHNDINQLLGKQIEEHLSVNTHERRISERDGDFQSEKLRKRMDRKSLNGQQYIMDNVLPVIAECFLEMTKLKRKTVGDFIKLLRTKGETFRIKDPFTLN